MHASRGSIFKLNYRKEFYFKMEIMSFLHSQQTRSYQFSALNHQINFQTANFQAVNNQQAHNYMIQYITYLIPRLPHNTIYLGCNSVENIIYFYVIKFVMLIGRCQLVERLWMQITLWDSGDSNKCIHVWSTISHSCK